MATRRLPRLAAALALAASWTAQGSAAPPPRAAPFNRAAWLGDWVRIKQALAQHYANLDWQITRRGFRPAHTDARVRALLAGATSDAAAMVVLHKLIQAFDDPHLDLELDPAERPRARAAPDPAASATPADCTAASYADDPDPGRLRYAQAPGWSPLPSTGFTAGLLHHTGVLRIPAFGEDRYRAACTAIFRRGLADRDLQLATRAELNRQLRTLLATLRARGMTRLVIDLTGNGGGSEWSSEVAAMFSAGPLTRVAPRLAAPICDRGALWRGAAAPCPVYAAAPTEERIAGTGLWTGPVAILADRRTASAAEEVITWLRDNGRAVVAGTRTAGAGCGYVDGGAPVRLRAVPVTLLIPNCSRYTRAGLNEIETLEPDLPTDWGSLAADDYPALFDRLFALPVRPR